MVTTMWHIVLFQTGGLRSTKNHTRTKLKKKYRRLSRQTSCLRRPCYLLRSFSTVFELVFMDTIRRSRATAVLQSVLFEGKGGEKGAEQDEEEFVVLFLSVVVLRPK